MNKPTLVLIPGLLSDIFVWQNQIAILEKHANIIIPDINHFNDADDLIKNIINISPPKFFLAGHSMGGWLAIELMRNFSSHVQKLCILATSAGLDSNKKMLLRKKCITLSSTVTEDELVNYLAQFYIYQPEIKANIIAMFKRNIKALIPQQEAMIKRASCKSILPKINVPTTVLIGQEDKEFFKPTKHIADHIPNAKLEIIKNCGHMLTLEQPKSCSDLMLNWLIS